MKKYLSILLLSGSLILTGCGDSADNVNPIGGQQPGPIVTPTPPVGIAGIFVDGTLGNDATAAAAAASNNATDQTPFKTIGAAVTAAGTNKTITVKPGTYNEAVTLLAGQKLLGTLGQAEPVLTQTLTLADGNTVDGFEFRSINGRAIQANGVSGGTIINNVIATTTGTDGIDGTGSGISILDASGTWNVNGNSITSADGIAIAFRISGADSLTAYVNNNMTNGNAGALVFLTQDTGQGLAQVHGNTMTGSGMEIIAGDSSVFGLDLEDNTNSNSYLFRVSDVGPATLNVEQLSVLDTAKPAGAGNTGTFTTSTGPGFVAPTEVANGSLGL